LESSHPPHKVIVTAWFNILFCVSLPYLLVIADGLWECRGTVMGMAGAEAAGSCRNNEGGVSDRKTTDK
jgi:hypothetical protein